MSNFSRNIEAFKTFWNGYKTFEQTGESVPEAYPAMRQLYVASNGWFNDIFHFLYCLNKPAVPLKSVGNKFLSLTNDNELKPALKGLKDHGYYVFPKRLSAETIDALMHFALTTPCVLDYDSASQQVEETNSNTLDKKTMLTLGQAVQSNECFDPENIIATNYRFEEERLLDNELIQSLMADSAILNLAQSYFNSQAMYTTVNLWWTTPFGLSTPSSNLAQMYHFDMDRIKFIKFFCYLTDVGPEDGPHCFVKNSTKRKPKQVLKDGRQTDAEIEAAYDSPDILEFNAPKGTIIVEDTRGFHKAKMPTKGNRLILQFEIASWLFGPAYPNSSMHLKSPELESLVQQNKNILANFKVKTESNNCKSAKVHANSL